MFLRVSYAVAIFIIEESPGSRDKSAR